MCVVAHNNNIKHTKHPTDNARADEMFKTQLSAAQETRGMYQLPNSIFYEYEESLKIWDKTASVRCTPIIQVVLIMA